MKKWQCAHAALQFYLQTSDANNGLSQHINIQLQFLMQQLKIVVRVARVLLARVNVTVDSNAIVGSSVVDIVVVVVVVVVHIGRSQARVKNHSK